MNTLQPDFSINKYGLYARLVTEDDVDFILKLRTNKELTKNIHSTDNDREAQIEWIRNYKKREAEGRDYYFIFFKECIPVALDRIYNIYSIYATPGSWIIDPQHSSFELALATSLINGYIMFHLLGVELSVYDVRKKNKQVVKFHKLMGAKIFTESDIDYFFYKNRKIYDESVEKYSKFLV